MVAMLLAGPAKSRTSAALGGMPAATIAAAIGTEAVAQTYQGSEMTRTINGAKSGSPNRL